MRFREITEAVGRITKQNQTSDVGPQEIKTQAAKFGNTVDKDGRPPTLSKKTKGSKTNVLFNLGLSESRNYRLFEDAVGEISKSTEIFVDMDGVLADFFGSWANLMNVDDWREINKKYNIDDALDRIRQTDDFWIKLPLTSNAKQLLNLIKQVKGSYKILSSPLPGDKNSEPHKRLWVKEHLKFFPPQDVIITHDKAKYATQPGGTPNILIDDYGVNISKWEDAGGIGFKHKDHKFERTAKNIKQHIDQPVDESLSKKSNESILDELNIPRNQMPQISMKDLKGNYNLEADRVDPSTLETSQDQRIPGMVDKTVKSIKNGFNKPLVVDKNGFIVNGHHRYDAYLELGVSQVPVIRVKDASIEDLIRDFSHTAKDTYAEDNVREKWSKKYKDSINCDNPKGFSQKAHCAGKQKNEDREIGIHRSSEDFAVIDLSKSADGTFWLNGLDNTDWDNTVTTGKGIDMAFEISPQAKLASYDDIDKYSTGELENMGYDGVRMIDGDNVSYQVWNTDILKRTKLGENFADGKKKGKSRPGRVKRAGASCNGSVTSLRKKAKNASGEKAKMYHWCANMKSGRKKS
jgi:5'(3')-deoxyribonucleotidase